MRFLKTNTAVIVTVGPFYDKTDGVTIENALTATNERITLTVDLDEGSAPTLVLDNVTGAASGTGNDIVVITNCDAGLYQIELAAANVNYLGRAMLTITDAANHVPVFHEFMIVSAQFYNFMCGATIPDVNVTKVGGTSQTAGDLKASITTVTDDVTAVHVHAQSILDNVATVDGIVDDILVDTGTDIPATLSVMSTAGVPVLYAPSTAVRTLGDNDGGTVANLAAHDESVFAIGENGTDGITATITKATSEIDETPTLVRVSGYYSGSASHYVSVYHYNYIHAAYELVGTMADRSTSFDYTFPMGVENHNAATGEMKIQFVHNTVSYVGAHVLNLDFVSFEKQLTATASSLGSDIAAIKAQTDKLQFVPNTEDLIVTMDGEIELATMEAKVDLILADTDEVQTDLTDGGRLDLILDAVLLDTGTTLNTTVNTISGVVDDILVDTAVIGALGAGLTALATQASVDLIAADVSTVETTLAVGGEMHLQIDIAAAGNDPAAIADEVWNEAMADHVAAGSFGEGVANAASAGDPWSTPIPGAYGAGTAGKKVSDMVVEVTAILQDTGTTLDTKINTIDGIVDTILLDTAELQTDWVNGGRLDLLIDHLGTDTNSILTNVDDLHTDVGTVIAASAPTAAAIADAVWDEVISSGHAVGNSSAVKLMAAAAGLATAQAGLGAVACVVTVTVATVALQGCDVWVTSDEAGTTVVAGTLQTDASGQVTFYLDAGTYYVWQQMDGYNFTNPDELVVT